MLSSHDQTKRLYDIAIATGMSKEKAKIIAAAGVKDLQGITKVYEN